MRTELEKFHDDSLIRAARCLHAMQGVSDPEEFMRRFKEMVKWRSGSHQHTNMLLAELSKCLECFGELEFGEYT